MFRTSFLQAFLFFAANCEEQICEDSALIQVARATMWTTSRDLAIVPSPAMMKFDDLELQFVSVIPTFGPQENHIALIHRKMPKQLAERANQFFCSGPHGSHRVKLRAVCPDCFFAILLCDWPKEEAGIGEYELFLEDANGKHIGQVKAKYQPSLLKQYGTMACVRNLWNDPKANVSGLADFPQWLDYHHMHGVEHFIIYTTSDMSPALLEVYQPYIDEGLVTRVHLDMPADKCWQSIHQQLLVLNDCLHRVKGHAKWLLPSLDVDEYVRIKSGPGEDITSFSDSVGHGQKVKSIIFEKYRFARTRAGLEISSTHYAPEPHSTARKYVVNVSAVSAVGIHQAVCGEGMDIEMNPKVASVNHYRHPNMKQLNDGQIATSRDDSLLGDVPILEKAMTTRYGEEWQKFLDRVKKAPELSQSACPELGSHGPAPWKKQQLLHPDT